LSVQDQIYRYVIDELGFNHAIACGILANAQAESGFRPNAVGDSGDAYGLFQWNSRREELFSYAGTRSPSVAQQLEFLGYELYNSEYVARSHIEDLEDTRDGAYEAGYNFCVYYERPSNKEEKGDIRGKAAQTLFDRYTPTSSPVSSKGKSIVSIARTVVEKKIPYIKGESLYDNDQRGTDSPGLVYYAYREAGVDIQEYSASEYYYKYKDRARKVTTSELAPGDLLFYDYHNQIIDVAIATGEGTRIYSKEGVGVIEETSIGSPIYVLRLLSSAETSIGRDSEATHTPGFESISPEEYIALSSLDFNAAKVASRLSELSTTGFDYGYLIDITHNEEFRFYIPEFSEQAGAQWSDVEIRGRSVSVKSYESTNSRVVSLSLDLYAGVGLYAPNSGESKEETLDRMYKDINFVKSLEYPDYSNPIIKPPPTVHLILGPTLSIVGVISNVSVEHLKPFDEQKRAMYVKLNFTVTQIAVNPPDYRDIRSGPTSALSTSNTASLYTAGTTIEGDPTNVPTYSEGE